MSISTMQDTLVYTGSGVAITNPIWMEWLQPSYQYLIAGLGLVVIILTIRNKWLEIQIKKNILEDHEKR